MDLTVMEILFSTNFARDPHFYMILIADWSNLQHLF